MREPDQGELEALWHAWHRHVLAYALRRTDPATAQDVVAETFVIAWRRLPEVPEPALPWLLGVARRVLSNHRRGDRRRAALADRVRRESPASTRDPAAAAESPVLTALAALREPDREALLLHAWEGLDNGAAATVLGCSPVAFAVRLHRARRRFARTLAALDDDRAPAQEVAP